MHKLNRSHKVMLAFIFLGVILTWGIRMQNMSASKVGAQLDEEDPAFADAKIYAENNGISLEEALRQFHLQEVAGDLQTRLRENEADTFAAIWIEHAPEFKIVVLFTQDAEQKIKPYLTDELIGVVEARDVKASLAMLENSQKQITSSLLDLGIQAEAETNVYENRISLFVNAHDRKELDTALQDKQLNLPDNVDIVTIWKLEELIPPSLGDHFPQLINAQNAYYDLPLIQGELVLDNGCLRLAGVKDMYAGDSFLIIWDPRFSTRTEQGVVQVTDSVTGEVLASVGDYVAMGNNGGDLFHPIRKPIPKECGKPYLLIGELIKKIDIP